MSVTSTQLILRARQQISSISYISLEALKDIRQQHNSANITHPSNSQKNPAAYKISQRSTDVISMTIHLSSHNWFFSFRFYGIEAAVTAANLLIDSGNSDSSKRPRWTCLHTDSLGWLKPMRLLSLNGSNCFDVLSDILVSQANALNCLPVWIFMQLLDPKVLLVE